MDIFQKLWNVLAFPQLFLWRAAKPLARAIWRQLGVLAEVVLVPVLGKAFYFLHKGLRGSSKK